MLPDKQIKQRYQFPKVEHIKVFMELFAKLSPANHAIHKIEQHRYKIRMMRLLLVIIQILMGNHQICQNCDRPTSDNALNVKMTNKRQIITLSYPPRPTASQANVQTAITQVSLLELPPNFNNFTGNGKVEYKPGWTYEGQLIRGEREGRGRMTWPTGDYYEGQFASGRASGRGVFQISNGTRYEGEFINDEIIRGKRISADYSQIYEGSFLNHSFDGYGMLIVEGSFSYKGMFRKNTMEGSGRIKYADGSFYDGAFKANRKHGYGIYTYADGQRFEGYWKEGERVGDALGLHSSFQHPMMNERNCQIVF